MEPREHSSARYAAIFGLVLLSLYAAAAGLWAVTAAPPPETTVELASQ